MRKLLLLAALFTIGAGSANSQNTFVTTLGSLGKETCSGLVETADSGFVITGSSSIGSNEDILLARFDKNGSLLWKKQFGGNLNDAGLAVAELPWGGFIISGHTLSWGVGGDVILVKTDANGDTLWSKVYGTSGDDIGRVVEVTPGGNYRITGVFKAGGTNKPGTIVVDSNGVVLANNYIANQFASPDYRSHYLHGNKMGVTGGSQMMMFTDTLGVYTGHVGYGSTSKSIDACYLPSGHYVMTWWADYGGSNINCGVLMVDTNLNKIWDNKYYTTDDDLPIWVKPDGRGGILLAVSTRNTNFVSKMKVIDLDMQGNIRWAQQYRPGFGNDHLQGDIVVTKDGGYATVASFVNATGDYDIALIKMDSLGNSGCDIQAATFQQLPTLESTPQSALTFAEPLTSNGNSIVTTSVTSAVMLNSHCNSITSVSEINSIPVSVWPNPANSILHIVTEEKNADYKVLDVAGREYQSGKLENSGQINVGNLAKGVYVVKLITGNASGVTKFVKE